MSQSTILKSCLLLISFFAMLTAFAETEDATVEIDYLLATVASSDCVFIRNGKSHSSADAVDHLQMKRRRGARYFSTTEEFIERLASKSSWTGKLYMIQCHDQPAEPSSAWFTRFLSEYRASEDKTN